ncbi:uncharacterized protein LOC115433438 isoform X2 [Sphaeramia orbicularis]|uniref:uncharacterized protein LOC115433438 isoform X2 n=1 Tax=Sphaeramia orbicularis TaxID=375764 RepID=UPI001180FAC4|nr:uncharacterized protein LOC115433438 isoform X2 [Sphaeramia orbicularis]
MNLFCFTLEGSTESMYEPAYGQTLREVLPKYQCSPALLRRTPEWGGSDPSINSRRSPSTTRVQRNNRRSCLLASTSDNKSLENNTNRKCWVSSADKKDSSHQNKFPKKAMSVASCQHRLSMRDDKLKEVDLEKQQIDLAAQGRETAADTAESIKTRRLKKLQILVPAKKGQGQSGAIKEKNASENYDHLADVLSTNNPVLTCIGLGKKMERCPSKTDTAPQHHPAKNTHEDSEEEPVWKPRVMNPPWSPEECPRPWTPLNHTCHQPRRELWDCGATLSLPRTAEWDRFESLIQELDSKQSNSPQMIRSITELHLSQNPLTRFGRFDAFRQHSPLMKPQDNGSPRKQEEKRGDSTISRLKEKEAKATSESDRKHIKASPEEMMTAITMKEAGGGFAKGHRPSSNSLESLYSLNSGQSSSSGVTSGSDCSSNRGSLRLDDDLSCTRQFCGRARVHTNFVPSPYDTESLKLKVGDVIDIVSKPPMGIWTGMLNNKIGRFKFIYVDLLTDEEPEETYEMRQKSPVHEVLKHLSLEEYSLSLRLSGYQTVDDLMKLRERHLIELNVTDPEHRHRLLAAVNSLQQLHSDSRLENDETLSDNQDRDLNPYPRDSGCLMVSENPDGSSEDDGLHLQSELHLLADVTAS